MKSYKVDERALGAAAALLSFLLVTKICLLLWHMGYTANRPLADLPPDGALYLAGFDLALCFAVAIAFAVLYRIDNALSSRGWPRVGRVIRPAMMAGIVVFSVASFDTARIYNGPLDIELLRAADDLTVFRRSIWAYVTVLPVVLLLYGLVIVPVLGLWMARLLERRKRLLDRRLLWASVAAFCFLVAGAEYVRLHRVETFGVKENAVVHFVRHYKPPFRPIDTGVAMAKLHERFGAEALARPAAPSSLASVTKTIARDFPAGLAAAARDFNVIVIQMESTGSLHLDRSTAPNIMALADRGLSFRRHTTTVTQTCPATYSLYYSDYLPDLKTQPALLYGRAMPQPSLPEEFHRAGYRTGVFHTGFLDYAQIRYLFQDKGVEKLVGAREMVEAGIPLAYSAGVHEERVADEIMAWVRSLKGEKFFAAYLTEFPHHPYLTMAEKPPFPDDTWLNKFKNSLHYADAAVGRLVAALRDEGLLDKTIIVVVGDHGETVSQYPVGHGLRVSVEEMRTPFILSNPKLFPSSTESRINSDHLDLAPTVASLAGLPAPAEWLGRDLLAGEVRDRLHFVSITHIGRLGVIDGDLLCVFQRGKDKPSFHQIGETDLIDSPPNDPRIAAGDAYTREADLFAGWSVYRHLARADKLRSLQQGDAVQAASVEQPAPQ